VIAAETGSTTVLERSDTNEAASPACVARGVPQEQMK
jgi:hypothetical protein